MADRELVIKIPEEKYNYVKKQVAEGIDNPLKVYITNGIPLPKGHGNLIDINNIDVIELEDSTHFIRHTKGDEVDVYISAPIIIEADRSEK